MKPKVLLAGNVKV